MIADILEGKEISNISFSNTNDKKLFCIDLCMGLHAHMNSSGYLFSIFCDNQIDDLKEKINNIFKFVIYNIHGKTQLSIIFVFLVDFLNIKFSSMEKYNTGYYDSEYKYTMDAMTTVFNVHDYSKMLNERRIELRHEISEILKIRYPEFRRRVA